MQDLDQIPVNVALVVRAENLEAAKLFLARIEEILNEDHDVRAVYRNLSVDKLWIMRGDGRD